MNKFTVEQANRNVLIVRFEDITRDWEQWLLITGDRHHDNPKTDQELEKKHLEQAKERNALVLDIGDTFCAMQGKYDPRKALGDIRPEHDGPDYLDRLVRTAVDFYKPYADNLLLWGLGNHESSILNRCGTNLISNLVYGLNSNGARCFNGFYGGWVLFRFQIHSPHSRQSKNLYYHHGAGGGGPVTRGVIQTNRQAVYLPDADIVVNAHTHDGWHVPIARHRIGQKGKMYQDVAHYIRTPTYKNAFGDGGDGWWNETWKPPKPIGCIWLRFSVDNRRVFVEVTPDVQ